MFIVESIPAEGKEGNDVTHFMYALCRLHPERTICLIYVLVTLTLCMTVKAANYSFRIDL